jgi:pimeloyl-ACP methyl ester carboxylesterase
VTLARVAAARAPGLAVDAIAGCGHDPTLEAPAALAALLAASID